MIDERDWSDFHDGLDALARGDADDAAVRRLEALAPGVPDGPTMLSLARRLGADRLGDLEARVPDRLVDATWDRLEAALPEATLPEAPDVRARPRRPAWRSPRAWGGLAAAAGLALVFLTGYLAGERRQLGERLAAWESIGAATVAAEARGDGAPVLPAADRTWTVGELRALLARLPDEAVLAEADDLDRLLVAGSALRRGPVRRLLADHAAADGLTVAEARALLTALAGDAETELDLRGLRLAAPVLSY